MPLSSLLANTDFGFGAPAYSRGRRAPHEIPGETDPRNPAKPVAEAAPAYDNPFDAAYYASRFKADLSELRVFSEERDEADAPPSDRDAADDAVLLDFFGNLSVLLVSVRMGDIERARAASDALALEVMIERSAADRRGDAHRPHMLDGLRQMLNAAKTGDESAARAAAGALARDVKRALDPPPRPIPDAPEIDTTAAAYETLVGYIDDEAPSAP